MKFSKVLGPTSIFVLSAMVSQAQPVSYWNAIHCDNNVNAYAISVTDLTKLVPGYVEYVDAAGALVREDATLSFNYIQTGNVKAESKNVTIMGTENADGYYIIRPAHDPFPARCMALPPPPSGSSVGN